MGQLGSLTTLIARVINAILSSGKCIIMWNVNGQGGITADRLNSMMQNVLNQFRTRTYYSTSLRARLKCRSTNQGRSSVRPWEAAQRRPRFIQLNLNETILAAFCPRFLVLLDFQSSPDIVWWRVNTRFRAWRAQFPVNLSECKYVAAVQGPAVRFATRR